MFSGKALAELEQVAEALSHHPHPILPATGGGPLPRAEEVQAPGPHMLRPFQGPGKSPSIVFPGSYVFVKIAKGIDFNHC